MITLRLLPEIKHFLCNPLPQGIEDLAMCVQIREQNVAKEKRATHSARPILASPPCNKETGGKVREAAPPPP
ncbi:hypothetical protein PR048_001299 [Dryococelus australis]|uniref:Uncharacterized protein n=1 Tax=Dryococelus australis TaxID=614101 RepID=A0ABQ9IJD7_9NEOP|nr:hypothetical protein PR048_001299 [Dryococelus australis]